ncbi:MAG: alpha-glucosidase/alpha-galactosidase, partial [Thermoprotei archaeon]
IEDDVVVEVPAIIDGNGVHPLHVKSLPKFLTRHIIKTHVIPMELGLQSFIERDRKILLYIILSDHRTKSLEQAQELIEKELALPFNKDLREWFRKETFEEYPYII